MSTSKQCSKCGELYDYGVPACPGCGYQGYKLVEVAVPESVSPGQVWTPTQARPWAASATSMAAAVSVLAWFPVGLMVLSFFLVWLQASILSGTYIKICETVLDNLKDATNLGGDRVLGLFVPAAAAVLALGGAARSRTRNGAVEMLCGGGLGLIAVWQVYDYLAKSGSGLIDLTKALGPGFWLFALASAATVGVGILAMAAAAAAEQQGAVPGGASASLPVGGPVGQPVAISDQIRNLDWRAILRQSWDTVKANFGPLALASLITVLIAAVPGYMLQRSSHGTSGYWLAQVLNFLICLPLTVGLVGMCLRALRGKQIQVGQVFEGFPRAGQVYLATIGPTLALAILTALILPPSLIARVREAAQAPTLSYFARCGLVYLADLFLYPFIVVIYPALADGTDGLTALKLSLQRGRDNWLQLFLLLLMAALIAVVPTVVTCGLGAIVAVPWVCCAISLAYLALARAGVPTVAPPPRPAPPLPYAPARTPDPGKGFDAIQAPAPPGGRPSGVTTAPRQAPAPAAVRVFDVQTARGATFDNRPTEVAGTFPISVKHVYVTYAFSVASPQTVYSWTLTRNGKDLPSFGGSNHFGFTDGHGHLDFHWQDGAPPGNYCVRILIRGGQVAQAQFTVGPAAPSPSRRRGATASTPEQAARDYLKDWVARGKPAWETERVIIPRVASEFGISKDRATAIVNRLRNLPKYGGR